MLRTLASTQGRSMCFIHLEQDWLTFILFFPNSNCLKNVSRSWSALDEMYDYMKSQILWPYSGARTAERGCQT